MEWLGELKSDADDPELQPVDPSVTQAFEAMLEEAKPADPSASPQSAPSPQGTPSLQGTPPAQSPPGAQIVQGELEPAVRPEPAIQV
ncbi:MAG: hypothetical protein ACRDNL_11900, partial [Spirillospora sp.]